MCKFNGCGNMVAPSGAKGYCSAHYNQLRNGKDLTPLGSTRRKANIKCGFEGCDKPPSGKWCGGHRRQMDVHGEMKPLKVFAKMGAGSINSQGYRLIYRESLRMLEHRWIMSQILGRSLFDNENVHHKNGDRLDNRPENLELWVVHQPKGQRVEDLLAWAKEIIERYDDFQTEWDCSGTF